jgi:hypothetical protein
MINKITGYIQVGDSRWPLDNWEITATIGDVPPPGLIAWHERLRAERSIRVEGTYEPTAFTRELFQLIDTASSITWHAVKPWRKHSKQTRAWYRVRARAERRKKFVVHSHRRWDTHAYWGREHSV